MMIPGDFLALSTITSLSSYADIYHKHKYGGRPQILRIDQIIEANFVKPEFLKILLDNILRHLFEDGDFVQEFQLICEILP